MIDEQLVDGHGEQFRHAQRQREARVVFVGLDGVDRLARHAEPPGKLALAPALRLTECLDPILHQAIMCKELLTVKSSLQDYFVDKIAAMGEDGDSASGQAGTLLRADRLAKFGPLLSKMALELFIVFVGVSAAFAVENYRDARQQDLRRQAVYRALDRELTQMAETHGPGFQREMTEQLSAWDRAVARGERPLPPTFRMPRAERPPTGVWDAAVATGSIELIDPELFFELARLYNRAESAGDLYQRYATSAQADVWARLDEGAGAFWQPDGKLRPEIKAHVQRLRDFQDLQGQRVIEAREIRAKLRQAAAN